VIFVSLNYRLGAFGWLSGPTFQEDGEANAGLWDQRFALEWVQKYICQFGGDPNRVTVVGESAGGGSIMHQITVSRKQCLAKRSHADKLRHSEVRMVRLRSHKPSCSHL